MDRHDLDAMKTEMASCDPAQLRALAARLFDAIDDGLLLHDLLADAILGVEDYLDDLAANEAPPRKAHEIPLDEWTGEDYDLDADR